MQRGLNNLEQFVFPHQKTAQLLSHKLLSFSLLLTYTHTHTHKIIGYSNNGINSIILAEWLTVKQAHSYISSL